MSSYAQSIFIYGKEELKYIEKKMINSNARE